MAPLPHQSVPMPYSEGGVPLSHSGCSSCPLHFILRLGSNWVTSSRPFRSTTSYFSGSAARVCPGTTGIYPVRLNPVGPVGSPSGLPHVCLVGWTGYRVVPGRYVSSPAFVLCSGFVWDPFCCEGVTPTPGTQLGRAYFRRTCLLRWDELCG
jgi:hypothetical protein